MDNDCAPLTPETLARLTQRFERGSGGVEGSGLGLSMVQGFARQTGGDLRLQSEAGKGTTVTLLLPSINSILAPCSN